MAPAGGFCPSVGLFRSTRFISALPPFLEASWSESFVTLPVQSPLAATDPSLPVPASSMCFAEAMVCVPVRAAAMVCVPVRAAAMFADALDGHGLGVAGRREQDDAVLVVLIGDDFGLGLPAAPSRVSVPSNSPMMGSNGGSDPRDWFAARAVAANARAESVHAVKSKLCET